MNKMYFQFIMAIMVIAVISLSACDKDVEQSIFVSTNDTLTNKVSNNNPIVIDGKEQKWTFSLGREKLSKGVVMDEATYYSDTKDNFDEDYKLLDTISFLYKKTKYSLKLLRVDRKSEPGKYFYVMIDNLNVKLDTACWAYERDEKNVRMYGRLYTWFAANALSKKIMMKLPVYKKNNPTEKLFATKLPVHARLLSRQDVCDIIECDAIGHLPSNGYTIERQIADLDENLHGYFYIPLFYYDVFVGGLEGPKDDIYDYSRGERILAGYKDSPIFDDNKFDLIKKEGLIWLKDRIIDSFTDEQCEHFPLQISRDGLDGETYSAYINCGFGNLHAFSVRYVFEPQYK